VVIASVVAAFTVLFEPTATVSLDSFAATRDYLILETLDTVKSRYVFWRYHEAASKAGAAVEGDKGRWEYCGAEAGEYS
jgi:prolyl oligopeptidase PreP (S9A serine peptidase family)